MQVIDARTPFWVIISEHADEPYQDTLLDSDRDLLIVAPNRQAIALIWAGQKRRVKGSIGTHPASLRHEERQFALRRLWSLRAIA